MTWQPVDGFFGQVYSDWSAAKITALVAYAVTETVGNALLVGIVWYERFGSDNRLRTLINQLTSAFCVMLVLMNLSLTNVVALQHVMGPMPDAVCAGVIFASNFFLTLGLLYLDTIVVIKYLYIFRWKTVGAVDDHRCARMATTLNAFAAFLLCVVMHVLGFNYNINYYFCTNTDPQTHAVQPDTEIRANSSSSGSSSLFGTMIVGGEHKYAFDVFCILPAASCGLHVFACMRIYCFKRKERKSTKTTSAGFSLVGMSSTNDPDPVSTSGGGGPVTAEVGFEEDGGKTSSCVGGRGSIEPDRSLSDLCTSMLSMFLVFVSCIPMILVVAYLSPDQLLTGAGNACLYLAHFGIQFVATVLLATTYYWRNRRLRRGIARRLAGAFGLRRDSAVGTKAGNRRKGGEAAASGVSVASASAADRLVRL